MTSQKWGPAALVTPCRTRSSSSSRLRNLGTASLGSRAADGSDGRRAADQPERGHHHAELLIQRARVGQVKLVIGIEEA